MARNPFRRLKQLLVRRRELARQEQRLLDEMISAFAATGADRSRRAKAGSRRRALSCPRCGRRFALPMHLGRHLATSHRRRAA